MNGKFSKTPSRGLYIGKYPPPPGGKISANVIWRKKYEKPKRKVGNVNEKGRKGKENEKRVSKRVK